MKETLYRPHIKDGDHLDRSKKNPNRYRGVSRDSDNKNPDIPEWEAVEVEVEDTKKNDSESNSEEKNNELLGNAILALGCFAGGICYQKYIHPWWVNKAQPWVSKKYDVVSSKIKGKLSSDKKKSKSVTMPIRKDDTVKTEIDYLALLDGYIDTPEFNMTEDELRNHIMEMVFHILQASKQIKIISNAMVRKENETEKQYLARKRKVEFEIGNAAALKLDAILANEQLKIDDITAHKILDLTGGGVRREGAYIPVKPEKILLYCERDSDS